MQVFLTGATGYIGSVVAERLLAAGHTVIGLARSSATATRLEKRQIVPFIGDLQQPEGLAVAAQESDGVIHTAFIHDFDDWAGAVQADIRVIDVFTRALAGSGKPFIATSDTSVLGDTGSAIADEDHPIAEGFLLAERAKAEQAVLAAAQQDIRSIVLRLPLYIYGRGGGTSYVPMRLQEAQEMGVTHYVAPGTHQISAVHVEDVAQLYVLAFEQSPVGSIFHAVTESGISEAAIAQAISQATGTPAGRISWDTAVAKWGKGIATFFSINNQVSADKAALQLGWKPQVRRLFLQDICEIS
ncbi:nad-dependent epimerase dehydratase [Leptolyngbya sp. Heron Island J]|uniref:NAD-dependent epimerase/dehydratase family protein n=1 Tax=Leptolyngbya sp. Heron Island J TaxID=1385935 RepID=UPI0003B98894|nr:NAD-dependent epimerase/dehydratase family protein [Leptolyngbya sp. Heron Island J]ESA31960.1 nad-dependent epimerase dehydratase [Leptolyngbya sp. Heron Island J]